MENSIARLEFPLASILVADKLFTYSFIVLLVTLNNFDDFCLYNPVTIVVIRSKLIDVNIIALDRDSLSNTRIGGRLFFNNLE